MLILFSHKLIMKLKIRLILILLLINVINLSGQTLDARLLHSINAQHEVATDGFFKFMSNSNSAIVVMTPLTIGITGYLKKDKNLMYNACMIGLASAVNTVVTVGSKYAANRARPFKEYPGYILKKSDAGSPSFPSGHTSSAFANATALSIAFPKWYVIVPSYAWAGTVAYSRMHLGVHYPSDVLLGAIIGAGCAYISYKGNQWLKKKYNYLGN